MIRENLMAPKMPPSHARAPSQNNTIVNNFMSKQGQNTDPRGSHVSPNRLQRAQSSTTGTKPSLSQKQQYLLQKYQQQVQRTTAAFSKTIKVPPQPLIHNSSTNPQTNQSHVKSRCLSGKSSGLFYRSKGSEKQRQTTIIGNIRENAGQKDQTPQPQKKHNSCLRSFLTACTSCKAKPAFPSDQAAIKKQLMPQSINAPKKQLFRVNGLTSESKHREDSKSHLIMKPNRPNSIKLLRSGSPKVQTSKELNQNNERGENTVTLRANKPRGNMTDRSNNSTLACAFTGTSALSTRNQAIIIQQTRNMQGLTSNAKSSPTGNMIECSHLTRLKTVAGDSCENSFTPRLDEDIRQRLFKGYNSPLNSKYEVQSEPFEISPLRNTSQKTIKHKIKPNYPPAVCIKHHQINLGELLDSTDAPTLNEWKLHLSSENAKEETQFQQADERNCNSQTQTEQDCSGINGTNNTIHHISISSQSDFTASMAKAQAHTMTFAQLPPGNFSDSNEGKPIAVLKTPKNLFSKLKVAKINLLEQEDVKLSIPTMNRQSRERSFDHTVSLLSQTMQKKAYQGSSLLDNTSTMLGQQENNCTVQTNVIDICISRESQENSNLNPERCVEQQTTQENLLKSAASSKTTPSIPRPKGSTSFLCKATQMKRQGHTKENSIYSQMLNYGGDDSSVTYRNLEARNSYICNSSTPMKQPSRKHSYTKSITSKQRSYTNSTIVDGDGSQLIITPILAANKKMKSFKSHSRKPKTRNLEEDNWMKKSSPLMATQKVPQAQTVVSKSLHQTTSSLLFLNGCLPIEPLELYNSTYPNAQKNSPEKPPIVQACSSIRSTSSKQGQVIIEPESPTPYNQFGPHEQKSQLLFSKPKYSTDVAKHVSDSNHKASMALQHSKSSLAVSFSDKSPALQRQQKKLQGSYHSKPTMQQPQQKYESLQTETGKYVPPINCVPRLLTKTLTITESQQIDGANLSRSMAFTKASTTTDCKKNQFVLKNIKNVNYDAAHQRKKSEKSPSTRQITKKQISKSFKSRSPPQKDKRKSTTENKQPQMLQPQPSRRVKNNDMKFNPRETIFQGQDSSATGQDSSSNRNREVEKATSKQLDSQLTENEKSLISNSRSSIESGPLHKLSKEINIEIKDLDETAEKQHERDFIKSQESARSIHLPSSRRPRSIRRKQGHQTETQIQSKFLDLSSPITTSHVLEVTQSHDSAAYQTKTGYSGGNFQKLEPVDGDDQSSCCSFSTSQLNFGAKQPQQQSNKSIKDQLIVTKVVKRKCLNRYYSFQYEREWQPLSKMGQLSFESLRDQKTKSVQKARSMSQQKRLLYQKFLTTSGTAQIKPGAKCYHSCDNEPLIGNLEKQNPNIKLIETMSEEPQTGIVQEILPELLQTETPTKIDQVEGMKEENFPAPAHATQVQVQKVQQNSRETSSSMFLCLPDARINKDFPKEGSVNVSKIFRQVEHSRDTNLLDDLSKSLECNNFFNDNNLLSSTNLRILDQAPMDEDVLINFGNDDEDLLAGHSDREYILNMLDDPINDDIMNPLRGLSTPKTKEHDNLFMTPDSRQSLENDMKNLQNYQSMTAQPKELLQRINNFFGNNGSRLSVISEEKSMILSVSATSQRQYNGLSLGGLMSSAFNSAQKSQSAQQQIYLRRGNLALQEEFKTFECNRHTVSSSGDKRSSLQRQNSTNCNPFSNMINEDEELQENNMKQLNKTELKTEYRSQRLMKTSEIRDLNSDNILYGDGGGTLENEPSIPLSQFEEQDYLDSQAD